MIMKRLQPSLILCALLMALLSTGVAAAGCTLSAPANHDWAAPVSGAAATGDDPQVQATLGAYAPALVAKDRERFPSLTAPTPAPFRSLRPKIFRDWCIFCLFLRLLVLQPIWPKLKWGHDRSPEPNNG